jgi:hypothetical protein
MSDLAMWVGEEHYPWPIDFIEEARKQGVSKQIPKTAIPMIEPGKTRLVLIHPRALVTVNTDGMTMMDLALELEREIIGHFEDDEEDEAREYMLQHIIDPETGRNMPKLTEWLKEAEIADFVDLKRLEEKYGIEYHPGFIGYTFLTGMQWIAPDEATDLPKELRGYGIEPVRVVYEENENDE